MPPVIDKILRAGEGKTLRKLKKLADQVNSIEEDFLEMSDAELRELTDKYRERLADGETLDDLLPEAFATAREAARRVLGQRHFDVQVMGGAALHLGHIAEMKTGEGKTLTAVLPAYLNALAGKGVHIVTVNDYLAKRDAEWMGRVHQFLGLEVGVILPQMSTKDRRAAYNADITYGTNNEFGFDYLRDNMALSLDECVQRGHNFAIVDEVDSILIDEARTPLIISGPAEQNSKWYVEFAKLVPRLKRAEPIPGEVDKYGPGDYEVNEKKRTVGITESGVEKVEDWLGIDNLYAPENTPLVSFLNNALKAKELFKRDKDYVVINGEVLIVDEFTGRILHGRRYNEGMHQAIEAKEGVPIKDENQTLATITLQNYFRLYDKLAGMTGTAATEAAEFNKTYKIGVVQIPTNKPMIRKDLPDVVYKTEQAKFEAVVDDIAERHEKGQPVLVGTTSVEKSERLSKMLKRRGIPHQVLNAKYHEKEAEIVAQAGRLGAVTIATNMAGRGTDILLGGNPEFLAKEALRKEKLTPEEAPERYQELLEKFKAETAAEREKVVELGGLYILGTERHESRRIDNQLRGRSGRQGDPGASRFYVSLEDDLMRLFGSERIAGLMTRLGWDDDQPIEHPQVTRAIENAQRKVEAHHFELRKQVLQFDDVLNKQREVVYRMRREILLGQGVRERVAETMERVIAAMVDAHCDEKTHREEWDLEGLSERFSGLTAGEARALAQELEGKERDAIRELLVAKAKEAYARREEKIGREAMKELERSVMLHFIDQKWMEHLRGMDDLREGIGLRAYGQKDPLLEYKFEAYQMFQSMMADIDEDVVRYLFRIQIVEKDAAARAQEQARAAAEARLRQAVFSGSGAGAANGAKAAPRRVTERVGRNDPCPCGSGKKYKKCCGA